MSARRPKTPSVRAIAPILALAGIAALATGCGGSSNPNDISGEPGKQLFVEKCGSCHVLAAAQTKGVTGPNLDEAFKNALEVGMKRSTVSSVVEEQIKEPMGDVMPANLVKGEDARAVAEYVADAIGQGGGETQEAEDTGTGKADANNEVDNPPDPDGQLSYKYKKLEAKSGKLTLLATNESSVPHNIAIEGDAKGAVVANGKTSKVTTSLKAGKYKFLCTVPGHAQAGMEGTLQVK